MALMVARDVFGNFTSAAFSVKNISVVVSVRVFNVFYPIKTTHLYVFSYHTFETKVCKLLLFLCLFFS